MKVILEFDLPQEQGEYECARLGPDFLIALHEVRARVFRPARKHGYQDKSIQRLITQSAECRALVERLEKIFNDILDDRGIDL